AKAANVVGMSALRENLARAQTAEDRQYRALPRLPAGNLEHGAIDRCHAQTVAAAMDRPRGAFVFDYAANGADELGCREPGDQGSRIAGPLGCRSDCTAHRSCLRTSLATTPQTGPIARRRVHGAEGAARGRRGRTN